MISLLIQLSYERKEKFNKPELQVVKFEGTQILADSSSCCERHIFVGYE